MLKHFAGIMKHLCYSSQDFEQKNFDLLVTVSVKKAQNYYIILIKIIEVVIFSQL